MMTTSMFAQGLAASPSDSHLAALPEQSVLLRFESGIQPDLLQHLAQPPATSFSQAAPRIARPFTPLPDIKGPVERITRLQSWAGLVESLDEGGFTALLTDETNPKNPIESVSLPMEEVTPSDHPLVQPGAAFYWTIGYRDRPDGQRERFSEIRFARQPSIGDTEQERIFRYADELAALLESE